MTASEVATIVAAAAAGAGIIFGLVKARGEWFSGTSSLVDLQAKTIDALQCKLDSLERQVGELRDHIRSLESAYRASRLCARASTCQNYVAVPDFMTEQEMDSE